MLALYNPQTGPRNRSSLRSQIMKVEGNGGVGLIGKILLRSVWVRLGPILLSVLCTFAHRSLFEPLAIVWTMLSTFQEAHSRQVRL